MIVNSVKKNIAYNLIRTTMQLMFPIITFAYASRVLLVEGMGKINFSKSIVQYFVLFALLGVTSYGIREGAKIRDDKYKLSKFVHEILIINFASTALSYIVFFISIILVPKFQEYRLLMLINSTTIIFSSLGVEWFYGAIEDYRYITIRSIIFQFFSLFLMLLLVKDASDIYIYAVITVISTGGANVLNFFHLKKFIICKPIGNYNVRQHLKPIIFFLASTLSGNIYLLLDTSMLGFLADDTAVGLYSAANKMIKMVISIISSASAVLFPRMAYYINFHEYSKYKLMLDKAFHLIVMVILPTFILMFLFSSDILVLFSGNVFIKADLTAKILSFVILLIPLSTVLSNQILLPLGKEKYQFITTTVGALLNVISNSILIPVFADKGAALGTLIAEIGVLITSIVLAQKTYRFFEALSSFKNYILATIIMVIVIIFISQLSINWFAKMLVTGGIGCLVYIMILYIFKDKYFFEFWNSIIYTNKARK